MAWRKVWNAAMFVASVVFLAAIGLHLLDLWGWLGGWLPDAKVGTFEIRDWVNVAVAWVGAYLAHLAYGISRKQDKIVDAQLRQRVRPVIYWESLGFEADDGSTRRPIHLHNAGDKTLRELDWSVLYPEGFEAFVTLEIEGGTLNEYAVAVGEGDEADPELYREVAGHYAGPVWPRRNKVIGYVISKRGTPKGLKLLWTATCEDGTFPQPLGIGEAKSVYADAPIE